MMIKYKEDNYLVKGHYILIIMMFQDLVISLIVPDHNGRRLTT